jgi:hypothetical protein
MDREHIDISEDKNKQAVPYPDLHGHSSFGSIVIFLLDCSLSAFLHYVRAVLVLQNQTELLLRLLSVFGVTFI